MKKTLLMVVFIVSCSAISFAEITGEATFYDNEKINITEYTASDNVFFSGRFQKLRYPVITNKTNNDMEVTVNYTLLVYGRASSGSEMITRNKSFKNVKITIQPHKSYLWLSNVEFMESRNNDFRALFTSDITYIDSILMTGFELVSFRIIEKNYEIR
jgi:uncharacterized protein YcfL